MATIQGIYIALFGRPADPTGLAYFNGVTGNGANLTAIGDLASTAEYQDRFEGKSTVEVIVDIYQSLFGRNPDQAGLNFFVAELAAGRQTINTIAINILDGAQNDDLAVVNNKIAAADAFTAALDQPDEVASYTGNEAAEAGRQFLLPITADAASIPDAAAIDAAVEAIVVVGGTQVLTEGVDILTGTVFNAPRGFTPGGTDQVNTLNDDDVLTGTGTNATLNLSFVNDADTGDNSIAPTLKGIANVNVDVRLDSSGTLDLQDASGVANLKINGIDAGTFTVDNLQAALTTLTIEESNAPDADIAVLHVDAALKGTADALALTVSDVQVDEVFVQEVGGSPDQGYETITLESTGSANEINKLFAEDLQTLVITGDESLRLGNVGPGTGEAIAYTAGLGNVAGSLTKIDASALTAGLEINLGAEVVANVDGKSGTKVDFTLIGTAQDDTIRLLSGFDSTGDNIDGGAGADKLQVFSSVANGKVTNVETLDIRSVTTAVTVDASLFTGLTSILVRDEGGAGPTTLNKLTSDLINNISIQHGVTGSNTLASDAIVANLLTQTATDTAKFTWADQLDGEDRLINTDPRFNQTISADKVESITLVDNDTESNTFLLTEGAELSGTLTLTGGSAGTFLNLDASNGGGLFAKDTSGLEADGKFVQDIGVAAAERFSAATIDASAYLGDVIVRVDTLRDSAGVALPGGGQAITLGAGNDTVIFDFINDTTAGLSISDTVKGGEGLDTLALDGDGVKINISASEWTNVSSIETIRLIGNNVAGLNTNTAEGSNDAYGRNSYNLTLTNDLIATNGAAVTGGRRIEIINDNDLTNEATGVANVATNEGVTIDARTLNAQSSFSYNGEEGANRTSDRFILSDANINGLALIDGGFNDLNTGKANEDILEVRNSAVVTVGDLAGLKNIGTIEFSNDQAATQTAVLQLDNATVEALVDSSHTAIAGQVETLTINAFDNPLIAGAFTVLNLDATQVTSAFLNLVINGDGGADIIKAGAGNDVINGGAGTDLITLGTGTDTIVYDVDNKVSADGDFVSGFSSGAGADVVSVDASDVGAGIVANLTNNVVALAASADNSIIVDATTGYANFAAAEAAVDGVNAATDDYLVLFYNTTSGNFELYADADSSAAGGEVLLASFVDLNAADATAAAQLVGITAANFAIV